MMLRIQVPEEIHEEFERIVQELYDGDETKAGQQAIRTFVHHEKKNLSSGTKFEQAMGKRMTIESDKDGHTEKGFGDALGKLKERKERLSKLF